MALKATTMLFVLAGKHFLQVRFSPLLNDFHWKSLLVLRGDWIAVFLQDATKINSCLPFNLFGFVFIYRGAVNLWGGSCAEGLRSLEASLVLFLHLSHCLFLHLVFPRPKACTLTIGQRDTPLAMTSWSIVTGPLTTTQTFPMFTWI